MTMIKRLCGRAQVSLLSLHDMTVTSWGGANQAVTGSTPEIYKQPNIETADRPHQPRGVLIWFVRPTKKAPHGNQRKVYG